jgi:uncharacterized membrane protein
VTERQLLRALAVVVLGIAVAPAVPIVVEAIAFWAGHPFLVSAWEAVSGPICHHWEWRTLHLDGRAYPVCARCTGLYLGYVAGLPVLVLGVVARDPKWLWRAMVLLAAIWLFGFLAALGEKIDLFRTANLTRVGLGVALGLPASAMLALWARAIGAASQEGAS